MVPTFVILGVAKAGTTTLYRVLEQHPDIAMARPKEPSFFARDFELGLTHYWETYYSHWNGESAVGEGGVANIHLPYVAENIKSSLPDAKLIVIFRNPIDRAYSHWWMNKIDGKEIDTFETCVQKNMDAIAEGRDFAEPEGRERWLAYNNREKGSAPYYMEPGMYIEHVEMYLEHFPRSQLLCLFFDELTKSPEKVFHQVYDHLGVSQPEQAPEQNQYNKASSTSSAGLRTLGHNLGVSRFLPLPVKKAAHALVSRWGQRPTMKPATRKILVDFYKPYNKRLEQFLDVDLSGWDRL